MERTQYIFPEEFERFPAGQQADKRYPILDVLARVAEVHHRSPTENGQRARLPLNRGNLAILNVLFWLRSGGMDISTRPA